MWRRMRVLAEIRLVDRDQVLHLVDDLHGERILVQAAAGDPAAVTGRQPYRLVDRHHRGGRIEQRSLERARGPLRADVAEIGGDPRPLPVDPVAPRAAALAFEHQLALRGIAERRHAAVEVAHVAEVCDECGELRRVELVRRHAGVGNTFGDEAAQILIARGAAESSGAEVDGAHLIALRAVARGARRGIEPRAGLDIDAAVRGATRMVRLAAGCAMRLPGAHNRSVQRLTTDAPANDWRMRHSFKAVGLIAGPPRRAESRLLRRRDRHDCRGRLADPRVPGLNPLRPHDAGGVDGLLLVLAAGPEQVHHGIVPFVAGVLGDPGVAFVFPHRDGDGVRPRESLPDPRR